MPNPDSAQTQTAKLPHRLIRPIGAYTLSGLAIHQELLLTLDRTRGYLLQVNPKTDGTTLLNTQQAAAFEEATGLALWEGKLYIARHHQVLTATLEDLTPTPLLSLPYLIDSIAVWQQTLYISSQKAGYIFIYDRDSHDLITKLPLPGIGVASIAVWGDYLWAVDQTEQTLFCLDRATGEQIFSVLTPFAGPTGVAVLPETTPDRGTVWVTYADDEAYVRDDPNNPDFPYQLTFRDRTFIHPLHYHYRPDERYAVSNRFRVEMIYAEEIEPLDEVQLGPFEWRIAFPADTLRQRVKSVEPIGHPFTEVEVNGQRVAVFKFDSLSGHDRHLFGWRAVLEVQGIKYQVTPRLVEGGPALPDDLQTRYLVDDDELAMDNPLILAAAETAVGRETNLLRKVLSIRNYVYDRLSYGIRPAIDTPDIVIERGIGSCGEYVGLLLALCRLNGIACRTVGRYKCPPHAEQINQPLVPEFNHVWIEFYVPDVGWLPMESNVDDIQDGGPYPTRFFMGLPWYHMEMAKEVPFERVHFAPADVEKEIKIGNLALNHVRFRILEEMPPV
ncbi:transglutaminase family protein [Romeria aff. gracilis LEGE 07310]|uniref:Transglutaminase family protein n=1 Tax=Vasconcelosia minhoensis LEGE 07310 TaxID=915328 RepID=A0A8J7AR47_9CYAN|nr:transglutaminase family protein [Romeria gracilis]MBE9078901.1 transglutaminase family protein [Romeria aff. gracilis LEGE 07310]